MRDTGADAGAGCAARASKGRPLGIGLIAAEQVDIVIDASGSPAVGVRHVLACCARGKHVVMVNVEADALAAMFRSGRRPDGSPVKVMPFESLRELSDTDLRALHLHLQSLPPRSRN